MSNIYDYIDENTEYTLNIGKSFQNSSKVPTASYHVFRCKLFDQLKLVVI